LPIFTTSGTSPGKGDIVLMQEKWNKMAKSMCLGPSSVLHAFEDQLLCYIFEIRECGMAVSSRLVIIKASSLCREFREKVAVAQYFYSSSWTVNQMVTSILQYDTRELEAKAVAFMTIVHPMVIGASRDQAFIINMDQSTVPFTFKDSEL